MACDLIRQVNSKTAIIDHWSLGGGTAMMLQINHRESHDVDLFLQDPQLLAFLDPQKHDFKFEIAPGAYHGDGVGFLKLSFQDIGELDFIVAQPKTVHPTIRREIEGENILLETVPEIITKKIVYRGAGLKPRDIFDIAAAGERYTDVIVAALRAYKSDVRSALETLDRLNPEFVNSAILQLQIRQKFAATAKTAVDRAKEILRAV